MPRLFPPVSFPTAIAFFLLAGLGIYLRINSIEPARGIGFDEEYYRLYVEQLSHQGFSSYPAMVSHYITTQEASRDGIPTPTRMSLIVAASAWHLLFQTSSLASVRAIACTASILILLAATGFAYRLKGAAFSLAMLALMTFSPLELYMAHRALADSFLCLTVLIILWSLWELLQKPSRAWLIIYGAGLILLILTKENAAFAYLAICSLLVANRWFKQGSVSGPVVYVTVLAPLAGVFILCLSAGGWRVFYEVYSLDVSKSFQTPYAVATGNGPWFRYILDLLLINPAVTLLAVGGAFCLTLKEKAGLYFLCFITASYIPMCNVPHGMNVRYAAIWDAPLSFLALLPVFRAEQALVGNTLKKLFLITALTVIALSEIENYLALFVDDSIYDPVPAYLLRALKIVEAH